MGEQSKMTVEKVTIEDIIDKGVDTYTLYENHYISDKQIVSKLLK